MSSGKRYGKEFQLEAVRLVIEQGYTYKVASDQLGVTDWTLRQWVKKLRESGELPPKGTPNSDANELRSMRKEIKRLQMENDILKKATAFFAKDSL